MRGGIGVAAGAKEQHAQRVLKVCPLGREGDRRPIRCFRPGMIAAGPGQLCEAGVDFRVLGVPRDQRSQSGLAAGDVAATKTVKRGFELGPVALLFEGLYGGGPPLVARLADRARGPGAARPVGAAWGGSKRRHQRD